VTCAAPCSPGEVARGQMFRHRVQWRRSPHQPHDQGMWPLTWSKVMQQIWCVIFSLFVLWFI